MTYYFNDYYNEEKFIIKCESKMELLQKIVERFKDDETLLDEIIEYLNANQDMEIVSLDSLNEL